MSPDVVSVEVEDGGFPRVSGDEPTQTSNGAGVQVFSPRERG